MPTRALAEATRSLQDEPPRVAGDVEWLGILHSRAREEQLDVVVGEFARGEVLQAIIGIGTLVAFGWLGSGMKIFPVASPFIPDPRSPTPPTA